MSQSGSRHSLRPFRCRVQAPICGHAPLRRLEADVERRTFLLGAAGALAGACLPRGARANVPKPYSFDATPPLNSRDGYISWMVANRGEDPVFLGQRWARFQALVAEQGRAGRPQQARLPADAARGVRAQAAISARAYEHAFLDIGYGVTISGPHVVRPHDHRHRRQARREGARDRHRLGLPVGLSRQPHRQGLDRSRSSSRSPSARAASTTG